MDIDKTIDKDDWMNDDDAIIDNALIRYLLLARLSGNKLLEDVVKEVIAKRKSPVDRIVEKHCPLCDDEASLLKQPFNKAERIAQLKAEIAAHLAEDEEPQPARQERKRMRSALERIADPRNTHFAGDAQIVAREALAQPHQGETK